MRFLTAGESHGESLVGIIEGFPCGLLIDEEKINCRLAARMATFGRGERSLIENDCVRIISGVSNGTTTGAPICLLIKNADSVSKPYNDKLRPGHSDMGGIAKYGYDDVNLVIERASARETAIRTALGEIALQFLSKLFITIAAHTVEIGGIKTEKTVLSAIEIAKRADTELRCCDKTRIDLFKRLICDAAQNGDTLGGKVEVVASGIPAGFGSFASADKRLNSVIASALMTVPSVKSISIGDEDISSLRGSQVSDRMMVENGKIRRDSNHSGGIDGGMSNGEDIIVRMGIKPVPTLKCGTHGVTLSGKETTDNYVRSDICVVPSIAVIAESVCAIALAEVILQELGGSTMEEVITRFLIKQEEVCKRLYTVRRQKN